MKIPATGPTYRNLSEVVAYLRALASSIAAGWRVEHKGDGGHGDISLDGLAWNGDTQTTVGAAGSASALPATPTGYLVITVDGTDRVVPFFDKS